MLELKFATQESVRGVTESPRLLVITTSPLALWSFLRAQLEHIAADGFAIAVITSPGELTDTCEAALNVPVHRVLMSRQIAPWADLVALVGLYRLIRRIRPMIVHTHTPKAGLLGMIAAWLARIPVRIYTVNGMASLTKSAGVSLILWSTERLACTLATKVQVVSATLAALVSDRRLCSRSKMFVIGAGGSHGVNLQRFNPARFNAFDRLRIRRRLRLPDDAIVIGFVGRIVREKGIEELAAAWMQVREQHPNAWLFLAGFYEPKDPISDEAKHILENDPRVRFSGGFLAQMPELYGAIDLCVLPTYREGLPNVVLEAGAMCVPVIATRTVGCLDAVRNEETGILVDARDATALAEAMLRLIGDEQLRHRLGNAARQFMAESFCETQFSAHLISRYRQFANGYSA